MAIRTPFMEDTAMVAGAINHFPIKANSGLLSEFFNFF
jgi:hypothetical protein